MLPIRLNRGLSILVGVSFFILNFYLEQYYAPKESPYNNGQFNSIVERCEMVTNFMKDHIDNPTLDNVKHINKEIRQILEDDYNLRMKQNIITKIVKNENTLTRNQLEILERKRNEFMEWDEKFTIAILEKVFHLEDFSNILNIAKEKGHFQSKDLTLTYMDNKYSIQLKNGLVFYTDRSTGTEEESLDSLLSRRFFLIDTMEQRYYLLIPLHLSEMYIEEHILEVKSEELTFILKGRVNYQTDHDYRRDDSI